ncbi:hypothetical protein GOQ04_23890 [Emticicia sp. ODNR4P]|nr:hypothetical protein [Emticicia sp. ODNR4P]
MSKGLAYGFKEFAILTVVFFILVFEVFSGAARFYLSSFGLVSLIYVPKILGFVLVVLTILTADIFSRNFWGVVFVLIIYSCIGLYNGASLENIGFSLYNYTILIFGIIYSDYIEKRRDWFFKLMLFCFIASIVGELLDLYTKVPWKGFSYQIGQTSIEASRQWGYFEFDRPAGFSRVSSSLAVILGLSALFLIALQKSKVLKFLYFIIASWMILLTTNKSSFIAFLLAIIFYLVSPRSKKTMFMSTIVIGILLPIMGIFFKYSLGDTLSNETFFLIAASFEDRLIITWPSVYEILLRKDSILTGAGIGCVGSSVARFPVAGFGAGRLNNLAYVDSTFLYLYSIFGVLGIYFYGLQVKISKILGNNIGSYAMMLNVIIFFCCFVGWFTDIFETSTPMLFIGLAIGKVISLGKSSNRRVSY